ncbi:hypothetical protein [Streptosporangium sp. NPDC004631]
MSHPTLVPCRPWCTEHHDGGQHPEDAYCLGVVPTPAGDLLLAELDGRPTLLLHRLQDVDLMLDEAEVVYAAMGRLLASAKAARQSELVGGVL